MWHRGRFFENDDFYSHNTCIRGLFLLCTQNESYVSQLEIKDGNPLKISGTSGKHNRKRTKRA
jgi:hypothetical protein